MRYGSASRDRWRNRHLNNEADTEMAIDESGASAVEVSPYAPARRSGLGEDCAPRRCVSYQAQKIS